jgi:hypothetical protein
LWLGFLEKTFLLILAVVVVPSAKGKTMTPSELTATGLLVAFVIGFAYLIWVDR